MAAHTSQVINDQPLYFVSHYCVIYLFFYKKSDRDLYSRKFSFCLSFVSGNDFVLVWNYYNKKKHEDAIWMSYIIM